MKKILFFLAVLFFAKFYIFSQSYADWDKVFSENTKGSVEDTYTAVGTALEKDKNAEEMYDIFILFFEKCEISYIENEEHKSEVDYKILCNTDFDKKTLKYPDFNTNANILIRYVSENNLNILNIIDLNKYDLKSEYKEISGRKLELQPKKFENKKVYLEARYERTSGRYALFKFYDEIDSESKTICAEYTEQAAEQLLHIKKSDFYSNNYYILYGTVKNSNFVIEYLEHK